MRTRTMQGAALHSRPQTLLKIGEVAKQSGVGIEALRFYERGGLIDRPVRTAHGYRLYTPDVLQRLAFIKRAQLLGFSLDEIKRIILDARAGRSPCAEVRAIVHHRLGELDERLKELRRYRKELAVILQEWDTVGRAPGAICGLIEGTEFEQGLKRRKQRRKNSTA